LRSGIRPTGFHNASGGRGHRISTRLPEINVMRTMLTIGLCGALVGLTTLFQPALAQQKSAKQCNDEWKADKAVIQASGRTKKVFIAECRGAIEATKPTQKVEPAGEGQHASESDAKATCPTDNVVWVNLNSHIYHASNSKSYGKTKRGAYMCEKESVAAGFRAPKLATRS
jgi:hypothetical protein